MAEASLVDEIWPDVKALRSLLENQTTPLAEALLLSESGGWRLVAVLPNVDSTGTRPIYAALDEAAQNGRVDVSLLSRLVLLDVADSDANALTYAPVSTSEPPRRLDVALPSLPGYTGAVLRRDERLERQRSGRRLEEAVASALADEGLHIERDVRLDIGWRPDFVITFGNDRRVLVNTVVADRRSVKTRIRDAAGMANIAAQPVILVMTPTDQGSLELDDSYGVVPVLPVDWEQGGLEGLRRALTSADRWTRANPGKSRH